MTRLADLPQRPVSCASCPFRHDVDTSAMPATMAFVDQFVMWHQVWPCHATMPDGELTDETRLCAQGKLGDRYG